MPHLPPLSRDAVPGFKQRFEHYENTRGFIPNSILTMSRRPAIALFGYLNRWNDTMATSLEDYPASVAERTIAGGGWQAGKHG